MLDLDLLLTVVGVALIVIGVGVFLLGKSKAGKDDHSNVFEAFGIKLDVANPSVLLIMFGVVLMLAPRFVPLGSRPGERFPKPDMPAVTVPADSASEVVVASSATEAPVRVAGQVSDIPLEATLADKPVSPKKPQEVADAGVKTASQPGVSGQAVRKEKPVPHAEPARPPAEPDAGRETAAVMTPSSRISRVPAPPVLPRLMILTEAMNYEGETDGSLRSKLHRELRTAVGDTLADAIRLDLQNPGFRGILRTGDWTSLCKRTQADHLLLADLTPVEVESFGIESANWPNMRYTAVACATGRVGRSGWIRMEPTVGDHFPLQQSVAGSARAFIRTNRHLLQ